jgi:hypothetical protein
MSRKSYNYNNYNKCNKSNYFRNNYQIGYDNIKIKDNNKKTLCNID